MFSFHECYNTGVADSKNTQENIAREYMQTLYHSEFRISGFLLKKIKFLKVLMKAWRMDNRSLDEEHSEEKEIRANQK